MNKNLIGDIILMRNSSWGEGMWALCDRTHWILDVKQGEEKQSWKGCLDISWPKVCECN